MKPIHTISPEELERIERFLTGGLLPEEAGAFTQSLLTDTILREKTEEVKLLLLGIKEAALEQRLPAFHQSLTPVIALKKTSSRMTRGRWMAAASLLVLIGLSCWWLLQARNNQEALYGKFYSPDPGLATVMSSSGDYDFEKAMVEYKSKEYAKAAKAWSALLKQRPRNDTLLYFTGAARQAMGDENGAMEQFLSVATNTRSAFYGDACWYMGLIYLKKGNKSQAIRFIQRSGHDKSAKILEAINKK